MHICVDMERLELIAYHAYNKIRDGLALLEGTRASYLFYDTTDNPDFLGQFSPVELNTLLRSVTGAAEYYDVARPDKDTIEILKAVFEALPLRTVSLDELDAQIDTMEEFFEDDPASAVRFKYVFGANVPVIVDQLRMDEGVFTSEFGCANVLLQLARQ